MRIKGEIKVLTAQQQISGYVISFLPVVLAVLIFMMLRLTPGDPASVIAGDAATTADVEEIRAKTAGKLVVPADVPEMSF